MASSKKKNDRFVNGKLHLPEVTLVAFGSTNVLGMIRALEHSSRGIKWGDVKLITHIPCRSIDEWNYHVIYTLWEHITTAYAMLIHPDGYVVHPEAWRDDFLLYDYIGAPWPLPTDNYSYRTPDGEIVRVGNSVSLRSRYLMSLPKEMGLVWKSYYGNTHEDGFLCCHNRRILEEQTCRFSTLDVAKYFSHETMIPEVQGITPFAFHKHAGTNAHYPNYEEE